MASPGAAGSIRLDKLLWFLRFARSRSLAQAVVAAGHIRLDGRRITRSSCAVHVGQTLVLPVGERIAVVRLLAIPAPSGSGSQAQAVYQNFRRGAARRHQPSYQRRWKSCASKCRARPYPMRVIRNCLLGVDAPPPGGIEASQERD